ncbi:MAG: choice-of-anchor Q domain-containing protein, partial [Actinomycetota bacterium]
MRSNPLTSPLRAALVAATTLAATGLVLTEAPTASAALFLVDTLSDDPADGYTLREAVADANAAGGLDIIGFDPALDGTIVLDGAPISIEDSVEIDGDDRITISGAGASRIFISFVPGTDLTVTGMTLTEGWSPADGGAIDFFQGNDLTLERVTVTDSHSVDDGGGLAVHATTGTVMIEDSAFIGNRAINGDGGGMVFTDVDVAVLMVDTVIHDNESTAGEGGGLFADTPNGTFQSVGIEVTENRAPIGLGGGLSVEATFVSLDEAHVSGNSAAGLAGVKLESLSANTNLTGVAINDNDGASFGGGGMIVASSVAHVHDAEVHGNQSAESSGLVVLGGSGVSIQDGSFIGNDASGDGGALTIVTTPTATIERTTIADNTAMTGPALRAVSVESLLVEESTLSGNDATTGNGGAILAAGDPSDMIELFATTVSGNSAGDDGGAIWAESVKVHAVASTIVENSALGSGGGAFLSGPAELHADNSIVVNDAPTAPDVSGAMEPDHALIGDTTGTTVLVGPGLVTGLDPMLWPLADNGGPTLTHLPHPDSPVVDGGDPTVVPIPGMTDQRGLERFVDVV